MDYIYICNTGSDSISKVCLKDFKEKTIDIYKEHERVGPHGICGWKSYVLVANNYNDTMSVLDIIEDKEMCNYYIGVHCNDLKVFKDHAYIVCGESNTLVIFDLINGKIIREIPCGNMPHSIDICLDTGLAVVANMESDDISIIDCVKNEGLKTIKLCGSYPTKAVFSKDGQRVLICESNIGMDCNGKVNIASVKSGRSIATIETGKSPVDICIESNKNMGFVSNFLDGTVSVLDLDILEEVDRIYLGGMPRGILRHKRCLYVGDNYNNILNRYDIYKGNKNVITIGKEPNGMTLI
ncbi:YncE family protein [Clostridium amazonitimonense]|uniref:YncE family protein n=1 Tax=Clostridium amazonitimonense TaxID=1499689 RepID=UPI000509B97C|nr:YncE family protein [Clostridium amazonitimonense]